MKFDYIFNYSKGSNAQQVSKFGISTVQYFPVVAWNKENYKALPVNLRIHAKFGKLRSSIKFRVLTLLRYVNCVKLPKKWN